MLETDDEEPVPNYMEHTTLDAVLFRVMNDDISDYPANIIASSGYISVGLAACLIRTIMFGFCDPTFRLDQGYLSYNSVGELRDRGDIRGTTL